MIIGLLNIMLISFDLLVLEVYCTCLHACSRLTRQNHWRNPRAKLVRPFHLIFSNFIMSSTFPWSVHRNNLYSSLVVSSLQHYLFVHRWGTSYNHFNLDKNSKRFKLFILYAENFSVPCNTRTVSERSLFFNFFPVHRSRDSRI